MGEVKVFGLWYSPYSKRVEIALKMKGVEYEFIEEDLQNKSDQLLMYNPVLKKVPVLVHNGKPISESLVIMEYIDETWKENPLLPSDPYERAQARFWAKFFDDKLQPLVRGTFLSEGEDAEKGISEFHEVLNILENELDGKKFFGGNEVGFVDIAAVFLAYWIPIFQEVSGREVLVREKFPGLCTWADELVGCSVIKENLPPKEKLVVMLEARYAALKANATT